MQIILLKCVLLFSLVPGVLQAEKPTSPAPAMIENIETSDNRILRIKSLDVLNHVLGGKRRVLELLTKLKVQAKDHPEIQRIESAIQRTQTHFKEDKEPLY